MKTENIQFVTDAQRDFVADDNPFSVIVGGYGSGKTWAGIHKCFRRIGQTGQNGIIIGPSYLQHNRSTVPMLMEIAQSLGLDIMVSQVNNCAHVLGSTIYLRSAEKRDQLAGVRGGWVFASDVHRWKDTKVWDQARRCCRPNDGSIGHMWADYDDNDPDQMDNWSLIAEMGSIPIYQLTTQCNYRLSGGYVADLEKETDGD